MSKYSNTSASGFTSYFTERGKALDATWEDSDIESALLVASEWIDNRFGSLFLGDKTGGFLQERDWPRIGATVIEGNTAHTFASDAIPDRIANAVYEAAFRQLTDPSLLNVDYTPNKYNKVSIEGAVSVEFKEFHFASELQTQILIIDQIIAPLLCEGKEYSSLTGMSVRV